MLALEVHASFVTLRKALAIEAHAETLPNLNYPSHIVDAGNLAPSYVATIWKSQRFGKPNVRDFSPSTMPLVRGNGHFSKQGNHGESY